jgi:farnesyl-diphosphate farnesyltransferase
MFPGLAVEFILRGSEDAGLLINGPPGLAGYKYSNIIIVVDTWSGYNGLMFAASLERRTFPYRFKRFLESFILAFSLTNIQKKYLNDQMQGVSRSFALVAPLIESPLDYYLATAYLICRVADNIEDNEQPLEWQKERFAEFNSLLKHPQRLNEILSAWEKEKWPGLNRDEIKMMGHARGNMLWELFYQYDPDVRDPIARWAQEMAKGMFLMKADTQNGFQHFTHRQGINILTTKVDYDLYCYFVAGTVGHMMTELVAYHYGINGTSAANLEAASEACGRALQKTNIVKDFAKDLSRGFSYLPDTWMKAVDYSPLSLEDAPASWKKMVLTDVLDELGDSFHYIEGLPLEAIGYRQACLLMMLPAYQTLLLAAKKQRALFTSQHQVKISRLTMIKCVSQAKSLAAHNDAIEDYIHNIRQAVDYCF